MLTKFSLTKNKLLKGDLSPFFIFFFVLFINLTFSQDKNFFDFRYKGEKITTFFYKSKGILYKSGNNITFEKNSHWYKDKTKDTYIFSDNYKTSNDFVSIDFHIVDSSFTNDNFYLRNELNQFEITFGEIKYEKNYKVNYLSKNKNYNITELFYKIDYNQYIKLVILSSKAIEKEFITDKKLFIGFANFINEFKERPGKVIDVLDFYFEKDYSKQIDLISQIDLDAYNTNSLYGSVLVDLHTNEGSFDKIKNQITKRKKININPKTEFLEIEKFLDKYIDNHDIVMLNEYHSYPHTRFNLMYALKNLKLKKYEYLALEAFHPKFVSHSSISIDFKNIEGYYLEEPTCALLVAYANSLGYKLLAYEEDEECDSLKGIDRRNCRDSVQAFNIKKLFDSRLNSKLVVIGGHAHIEKKTRNDWKFMRVVIDGILPTKKIISIDQDIYIRTNLEIKDLDFNKPTIFLSEDDKYDAYMISPFYSNYYDYYYYQNEIMNNKVSFELKNKEIYTIEVVSKENPNLTIFRSKVENLLNYYIFLPEIIEYEIIYKNINNKIIKI